MNTSVRVLYPFLALLILTLNTTPSQSQWVRQPSGVIAKLADVVMLDSLTGVVVGEEGTIIRTTNAGQTWIPIESGGVTGIRDEVGELPVNFGLEQNFPNTFNPRTVVSSQLPGPVRCDW